MKKILFLLFALLIVGTTSAQDNILHVDAGQDLGTISPYVYGANYGAASVITPDLMPQAQTLGIKYLRLGGNRSDDVDLDNLSIDLLVSQARQLGAEPNISVRLLNGTPEKAADIVRYANIQKEYNVRFWSIGNEPSFFVPVHHAASYTAEDLAQQWRAIAEAMLAVDPTITLVGPDVSQYVVLNADPNNIQYLEGNQGGAPRDPNGHDWMQEFLRVNGDILGVVSIHRYPYPGGQAVATPTKEGLQEINREWEVSIPALRQVIRQWAGRDIPIAITEINSNSIPTIGGETGPDSFYNAIWLGDALGRLIRQGVEIVAYWNIRSKGDGFGLFGTDDMRPSGNVYLMYGHFGTELVASDWTEGGATIFAAKREDGALTLMVVNMGADDVTETLKLDNFTPGGAAEVWRFDADHNAEQIDSLELADGSTITMPGESITLYVLPA